MAHFTVVDVSNFISIYITYNLLYVYFELKVKADTYTTLEKILWHYDFLTNCRN